MGGIAYIQKHEYEAMQTRIAQLERELSGMTMEASRKSREAQDARLENERLRAVLSDMTGRVVKSWELMDLAPDDDLEAVARAEKMTGYRPSSIEQSDDQSR